MVARNSKVTADEPSTALTRVSSDELSELLSFDDAVKFLAGKGYDVTTAEEFLSDGFREVEKKDLINRPFVIVDAKVSISKDYTDDEGDPARFVIVKIITQDNQRFRFTDGSAKSGIANQVLALESKRHGGAVGVIIPKGLTVSEYDFTDETGKTTKAKTYYFGTE